MVLETILTLAVLVTAFKDLVLTTDRLLQKVEEVKEIPASVHSFRRKLSHVLACLSFLYKHDRSKLVEPQLLHDLEEELCLITSDFDEVKNRIINSKIKIIKTYLRSDKFLSTLGNINSRLSLFEIRIENQMISISTYGRLSAQMGHLTNLITSELLLEREKLPYEVRRNTELLQKNLVQHASQLQPEEKSVTSSSLVASTSSSTGVLEEADIDIFRELPHAIQYLIDEFSSGSSSRRRQMAKDIDEVWNGWFIPRKQFQFQVDDEGEDVVLGKGQFGVVKSANLYLSNSDRGVQKSINIAVKTIHIKPDQFSSMGPRLLREIFLQMTFQHRCLLQCYGASLPKVLRNAIRTEFKTVPSPYRSPVHILMPRMSCDLAQAIKAGVLRSDEQKLKVLMDVASGLTYLHHTGIVHRDLKLENILLNLDGEKIIGEAKVADFGCSKKIQDKSHQYLSHSSETTGTWLYRPPESIAETIELRTWEQRDSWSYGILICMLFSSQEIIPQHSAWKPEHETYSHDNLSDVEDWTSTISNPFLFELAVNCLVRDPKERPAMAMIYSELIHLKLEPNSLRREITFDHGCLLILRTVQWVRRIGSSIIPEVDLRILLKESARLFSRDVLNFKKRLEFYLRFATQINRIQDGDGDCTQIYTDFTQTVYNASTVIVNNVSSFLAINVIPFVDDEIQNLYKDVFVALKECHRFIVSRQSELCIEQKCSQRDPGIMLPKIKYLLGLSYMFGLGIEKDYKRATHLFKDSALSNYSEAQYLLGVCYLGGFGVEMNVSKAIKQYKVAANGGNHLALFDLGFCYQHGNGVEQNNNKAFFYFTTAAVDGFTTAQTYLGQCYEHGIINEKNITKAMYFYEKAAKSGNDEAKWLHNRLDQHISDPEFTFRSSSQPTSRRVTFSETVTVVGVQETYDADSCNQDNNS